MRRVFLVVALFFLWTVPFGQNGQNARATSVIRLSLGEMQARADVVVDARVVGQHVVEENGRPVTYTDLLVVDAAKGANAGDVLTVFQPGVLDGVRVQWIVGAHVFHVGDEVVFYAKRFHRKAPSSAESPPSPPSPPSPSSAESQPDPADVIVALTAGYGVFTLDHGAFLEDAGGAIDVATGATSPARAFATFGDIVGAP